LLEESCGATFVDKETLFKTSDIVSLHIPLLPSTHHFVNKELLSHMKSTAFNINTSRGPVIDEVALVDALKRDVIRGAGLDVYEFEPNLTEELNVLPDIVLTPHIASARESVRRKMSEISAQNVISFLETGKALNEVKGV
jgi:lactate dehydrogenase-like 2-hydroxyacid dehydrogenase